MGNFGLPIIAVRHRREALALSPCGGEGGRGVGLWKGAGSEATTTRQRESERADRMTGRDGCHVRVRWSTPSRSAACSNALSRRG
jgi:hypothetical protein